MNELKIYRDLEDYLGYDEVPLEMYDKYEVDNMIAKLQENVRKERSAKVDYKISANDLSEGLAQAYSENRHHKYKRCLAMAMRCKAERDIFNLTPKTTKVKFFARWHKRWLALAEKFKEVQ